MMDNIRIIEEFTINDVIGLRLVEQDIGNGNRRMKTVIVLNGEQISQCMYLLMDFTEKQAEESHEYVNIDELGKRYSRRMETSRKEYAITPEEEFKGHCSNIQAWVELDYNPNVLHSSLAVPLLTKLALSDIKMFHTLLYHLDEMWVQYKTVARKKFVIAKYGKLIYTCLHKFSTIGQFYNDLNNSVFGSALYKVRLFDKWSRLGRLIRDNVHHYFSVQYAREEKAKAQRIYRIENKEKLAFMRAERSIWGAGNLKHREWLRALRNHNVLITSPIEDYPAYIWATHGITSSSYNYDKWHTFWKEYRSCVGIARWNAEAYIEDDMEYYYHIEWLRCYTSGWGYTTYERRVIVRYKDGHYETKTLIMAR